MDNHKRKSWADHDIGSSEYQDGLTKFVKLAFFNACSGRIACPCSKCVKYYQRSQEEVYDHLVINGPMRDFEKWFGNVDLGSTSTPLEDDQPQIESHNADSVAQMLGDAFGFHDEILNNVINLEDEVNHDVEFEQPNEPNTSNVDMFNKLLKDAEVELYPGSKNYSRLSFILHLYHIKSVFGWNDASLGELLKFFKKVLSEGETIPNSLYETKKIIQGISLSYQKIDACPNDCMLFWKDKVTDDNCSVCGASRWKLSTAESAGSARDSSSLKPNKERKIPVKVLRYFPLKPRLQRLYMSFKTAEDMIWNDKDREKENGVLRHPADSEAWQNIDTRHLEFKAEPRNVRLGLASDGFNPFGEKRSTYSTWPVILATYNLPPWLCMKKPYLMLSLLIPGPKAPDNDIDVYLQPLIDDLKELWEIGVPTYDAYKQEYFQLHASLLWTINDFPGYGNLSGWCVYGRNACPCCNEDTWSKRYKNSGKVCYMGHRRFLDVDHKYRYDEKSFDNTKEFAEAHVLSSGSEVLEQLKDIVFTLGKTTKEISGVGEKTWRKRSIFFRLPYWEDNLLRHNLDVMHIEKNVCDNIINTLLNVNKKTKDNLKARRTLEEIGVRRHLWPGKRASGSLFLPPAPFSLSNEAKDRFCEVLENVKFPDGYASNIARCVLKRKFFGLKSHDCHVLMQLMLPLAMRDNVNEKVASVLIELCDFFRALCCKTLRVSELEHLQEKIVITLCNLEKIFPPTFFTIMVHLVVHLANEAKIAGPVHYRWMYPIERYLSSLGSFVRNRACPEGSMAEGYILHECLLFCARYMDDVEGRNRSSRNTAVAGENGKGLFPTIGQPYGRKDGFMMDEKIRTQAHRYVLFNSDSMEMDSLQEAHIAYLKRIHRRSRPTQLMLDRMHNELFSKWLKDFVNDPDNASDNRITDDVKSLAFGPMPIAKRFQAFDLNNGYRFRTKDYERNRKTQNSGVMVVAKTQSYASTRDTRPVMGDVTYYGVLTDIIELNYYSRFKIVLFKCNWVDINHANGIKKDKLGFTLVNLSHSIHTGERLSDEPFVFASQVHQVMYVQDRTHHDWFVPKPIRPRDNFDKSDENTETDLDVENETQTSSAISSGEQNCDIDIEDMSWMTTDVILEGIDVI